MKSLQFLPKSSFREKVEVRFGFYIFQPTSVAGEFLKESFQIIKADLIRQVILDTSFPLFFLLDPIIPHVDSLISDPRKEPSTLFGNNPLHIQNETSPDAYNRATRTPQGYSPMIEIQGNSPFTLGWGHTSFSTKLYDLVNDIKHKQLFTKSFTVSVLCPSYRPNLF